VHLWIGGIDGEDNNSLIISDAANYAASCGHTTHQTNPTVYIQSDLACSVTPAVGAAGSRNGWLLHDGTSAALGDLNIGTTAGGLDLTGVNANYMIPPRILSASPAAPVTCASPYDGTIVYVDDTDDTAYGQVCICANLDGTAYDWRLLADITGTACPFF
jgi:hypothetical protein